MSVRRHCESTASLLPWGRRCQSVADVDFQPRLSSDRKMLSVNSVATFLLTSVELEFLFQGSKYITGVHSHISSSSPIIHILKNTYISFTSCILLQRAAVAVCPIIAQAS